MAQQNINNLRIFLDTTKGNYDTIANADNALDGKVGTLMGIEIALGVGYFTVFFNCLTCLNIWGLILLGFSIVFLLSVNLPKTYLPFSINVFEKLDYLQMAEGKMLIQLLSDGQSAIDKNSLNLKRKVSLYRYALALLIISSILLIIK